MLVDKVHVIHKWAESFHKDYSELKTLRVILGNEILWWALSATFMNKTFKTVYKTLSFGMSWLFWGINVSTEQPNLAQHVWLMESTAASYLSLILFIPSHAVEFRCLKVVNPMSYLTVGSLENTSRLVDVSLNWTINSTG